MARLWCESHDLSNLSKEMILTIARQKFSHGEQWTPPNETSSNDTHNPQPHTSNVKSKDREWKEARSLFHKACGIKAKSIGVDYDIMNGYLKRIWPNRRDMDTYQFQRGKSYVENLSSSDINELRKWQATKDRKEAKETR